MSSLSSVLSPFKAFKVFVTLKLCVSPTELDPVGGAVTAEAIASAAVAAKSGGAASVEKREPGKVSPTVRSMIMQL